MRGRKKRSWKVAALLLGRALMEELDAAIMLTLPLVRSTSELTIRIGLFILVLLLTLLFEKNIYD